MKEFDWQSAWEQSNESAGRWYQQVRPDVAMRIRQRHEDVLSYLRRLMLYELYVGGIAILVLLYVCRSLPLPLLGLLFAGLAGMMYLSFMYFQRFNRKITAVPTLDVVASTRAYIDLIADYRQRLLRLALILTPISLILGFFAGFGIGANNDFGPLYTLKFWALALPLLALLAILCYWGMRWYYNYFVGKQEERLKAVLAGMEEEE
ncbi:MAG: hypothetical protein R2795_00785 [Saprospiraceae bacterium]